MIKVFVIAIIFVSTGIYIIFNAEYFRTEGAEKHKANMAKIGINVFDTPPTKYPFIFVGILCIVLGVIFVLITLLKK